MGILDLFKKIDKVLSEHEKPAKPVNRDDYGLAELKKKEREADKELETLQKADKQYYEDNDIEKRRDVKILQMSILIRLQHHYYFKGLSN